MMRRDDDGASRPNGGHDCLTLCYQMIGCYCLLLYVMLTTDNYHK
jgi:hypothetical protein